MDVIKRCHEELLKDSHRVTCTIKMDYRKEAGNRLEGKVESVEKRLGRKLRT
jgi:uncharacterized protein YqgV (UPF0045/DUF77 family)